MFEELVGHWVYRGVERPVTERAYEYILAGNGLFKRARNGWLAACIPVAGARVAGLPAYEEMGVELRIGRIPGRMLYPVLADAWKYAVRGQERMYQFRFVKELGRWQLISPGQRMGTAQVAYQAPTGPGQADGEGLLVCDLHSHHRMAAFFSNTDNRDEGGFRFYAVIGRLLTRPELRLRLGMYGDFWEVPVGTLFTDGGPFNPLPATSGRLASPPLAQFPRPGRGPGHYADWGREKE